jgi:hypothetical protein
MRLPFIAIAAVFALVISAGTPHATGCYSSYDCGYRETCQNSQCVYDSLSCKYDSECGAWEYCNTGTYQCQRSQGRCVTSSDCYGYQYCDANHYCASSPGPEAPGGAMGAALNQTNNRSQSDFGSTNPKLNNTIQKLKKSINQSLVLRQQQSRESVGGFFDFFFDFLRKLFGG